ncbi:methyltransferase family protein [Methyloligella solikamskensis]|uniref:Methyltransferase family protein n=1 Tax=Methyloligella solikamskensis TaxID=1177756 RepID=A0ABW3J714_9HYPH
MRSNAANKPANQKARIRLLQFGAALFLVGFMAIQPVFSHDGSDTIECIGVSLVLLCVAGRAWSSLYIGDKKNRELVTAGPYSMTRNPLYFFSMLGAVGIGLFAGSLVLAGLLGCLTYLILTTTAVKEAIHLDSLFGESYRDYEGRTPEFWPRPMLYSDAEQVTFSPDALKRTVLDGLLFIVALPAIELLEVVKESGYMSAGFTLL